ncbi:hypothetical protein Q7689_03760 [Nocardiopsis tropica]|uniref:hypothetical protein n=1 Tax=Nocardiopsis tropica TaxID=109330 RepID=UPI002E887752|nr:hypothetical protein [Nocardiopsis tropica]
MPSTLLIVAGCALACVWSLWVVIDSEEKRLKKRNDLLTFLAIVAASFGAGMALAAIGDARPESTGMEVPLVLLAVCALCALCGLVTEDRYWGGILLLVALGAAMAALVLALLGMVMTDPGAREAVGEVVGEVLKALLTLVGIVVALIVGVGFVILMSWEDPKHGIDRSGGAGYSGSGKDEGGFDGYGGVSGDGGDGGSD